MMRSAEKEYGEGAGINRVQMCYFRSMAARRICQGLVMMSVRIGTILIDEMEQLYCLHAEPGAPLLGIETKDLPFLL